MSPRKKRKKNFVRPYVKPPWFAIESDLLLSRAFQKISASAAVLLLHVLRIDSKLSYAQGDAYCGEFNLTFSEAEQFGLSRATIGRAFQDLVEWGFIETVVQGGLKSSRKTSSVYKVVERWRCKGGLQTLKELDNLKKLGSIP